MARWLREEADLNSPVQQSRVGGLLETGTFGVFREPIGEGRKTQSQDGSPIGPLIGNVPKFDGGISGFRLEPFIYTACANDHAVMFQFLPSCVEMTDVIVTWLVDGATPDFAIDIEGMIWLWDVTTLQDKAIIQRNAAGVRSLAYSPGPYSTLEAWPSRLAGYFLKGLLGLADSIPAARLTKSAT